VAWLTLDRLNDRTILRSQPSLKVTMCHYNSIGHLEESIVSIEETDYLAISHVWGKAEPQRIPVFNKSILASKEKAEFITKALRGIVGVNYFWMDILCVDQDDREARIAVTQHIPAIFRRAQRTVVIRNGTALGPCCLDGIGGVIGLDNKDIRTGWRAQLSEHHANSHEGDDFKEGVLSRLWVLQEVMLSDTLQFVQCQPCRDTSENVRPFPDENSRTRAVTRLSIELDDLANSWVILGGEPCEQGVHDVRNFLVAFLT
jgi:hypothetical protein